MPFPRWLATANRRITNRITPAAASRLPGFGIVEHTGRRSGRRYRTPVNVFAAGDGYVVALTYGSDSDWVKNVMAAGGCELVHRGRRERLDAPCIARDETRRHVPAAIRPMLAVLGVSEFMTLHAEPAPAPTPVPAAPNPPNPPPTHPT
jgi:deazaflavin-dependent oxidoreductase (nitroreductase family)